MAEGSLRDEKRRERAKFASMTMEQKLNYIKTYYLAPIIIVILAFILIVWGILEIFVLNKVVIMDGCTINVRLTDETKEYLTDGFLEYLNGDTKKEVVHLNSDNYVDYSEDEDAPFGQSMGGYTDQTMLFTQIAAGEFSYMIIDESALINIGDSGYFAYLEDVLDSDILDKCQIYYDDSERAIGINLKDTSINVDAYLVIAEFVPPDKAKAIIEYIVKNEK